ncbi:ABC transporter substrate-binding protein, partial [Halobacteriales archaeon SW_5_68_122]
MTDDSYEQTETNTESGTGRLTKRRPFLQATGAGAAGVAFAGCLGDSDSGDGTVPDTITIGVEVSTKDTKDQPSTARDVYKELTTGENVEATVGIFGSEQLLAIMDDIAQAETVHLTSGAATPEAPALLAEDYETYKPWFRVGPTNSTFLDDSLVTFAKERFDSMGWEKVAFIAEDFKWTEPVTEDIKQRLINEANVEVTRVSRVSESTEDFTPIYEEIENDGVDGVYTALAHIGTKALVQWAKQQRPFGFGGIHVPTQLPSYYAATEGA